MALITRNLKRCVDRKRQFGGAALEYILVTTFAAVAGIAALGFIGKVIKDRISVMADKLGIEAGEIDVNPFGNDK